MIQKPGVARRYPVAARSAGELHYRATLKVPVRVKPIAPERAVDTPFRTFAWKAVAEPAGGGTTLRLSLDHRYRPAAFGFEDREKGVQAWKQDRSKVKALREDGLAFESVP